MGILLPFYLVANVMAKESTLFLMSPSVAFITNLPLVEQMGR